MNTFRDTPEYSTKFRVVYHVALLNHWREVMREQLPLLLANKNIAELHVTIGTDANTEEQEATALLRDFVERKDAVGSCCWYRTALHECEHKAMMLVDQLARRDDMPVLYFHGKGVSYSPPVSSNESFRKYLNRLVAEADRWAEFLAQSDCDACGPLLFLDETHGLQFFAGNFWMAKASYLRSLVLYEEFASNPGAALTPWGRHLAEMAVNRMGRMRPHAIDGTSLTPATFNAHMTALTEPAVNLPGNKGASFITLAVIVGADDPEK